MRPPAEPASGERVGSAAGAPAVAPKPKSDRTPPSTRRNTPKPKAATRSKPGTLRQPAQPAGAPPGPRTNRPAEPGRPDLIGTAVQAAAELAEIGLSVSAQAIRRAVSRLPKP